jgi:hypothetical protein
MQRPGTRDLQAQTGLPVWLRRLLGINEEQQQPPVVQPPQPTQPSQPNEPERPTIIARVRYETNFSYNNQTMLNQLQAAMQYKNIVDELAQRYGYQPSVLGGIGSRESHWGLALRPPHPGGRGDFAKRAPRGNRTGLEPPDGGGYGRGLMQIDYDWHEFARTGNWHIPYENIDYACRVLQDADRFFKTRLKLNQYDHLRAVLAAYNAGATATLRAIQEGRGIDGSTTGRDYSRDVLNRSGWFQLHGWA